MLRAIAGVLRTTRVSIADINVTDTNSGAAQATYALENDGDIITTTNFGGAVDAGDWVVPKSAAGAAYEVRATIVSGTVDSGSSATGSWLALSTTRSWNVQRATTGTKAVSLTIEIRLTATGVVLDSAAVLLTADVL